MALIETKHGQMDESLLEKTVGVLDNENELTTFTEYRMKGDPAPRIENGICLDCRDGICRHVHRSVDIKLKKASVLAIGEAGSFQQ